MFNVFFCLNLCNYWNHQSSNTIKMLAAYFYLLHSRVLGIVCDFCFCKGCFCMGLSPWFRLVSCWGMVWTGVELEIWRIFATQVSACFSKVYLWCCMCQCVTCTPLALLLCVFEWYLLSVASVVGDGGILLVLFYI